MFKVKLRLFKPLPFSVTYHETIDEAIAYFFKEFDDYYADKTDKIHDISTEALMEMFHMINIGAVWDIVERRKHKPKKVRQ